MPALALGGERLSQLWAIEDEVRGRVPEERGTARREGSSVIVHNLFKLEQDTLPRISGKSNFNEAIRYALSRRIALKRFPLNGRIEIDHRRPGHQTADHCTGKCPVRRQRRRPSSNY